MIKVDITADCGFGDNGKGKIVSHLLLQKTLFGKNKYDYCLKSSGGHNCGHSVIFNNKKIITHIIPIGVIHGIKSIIGCGCVINPEKFFAEIEYLENNGINCKHLIKIAHNAHIITKEHIEEDIKNEENGKGVGSTKQGNMPAFRCKYGRTGIQAKQIPELQPFIVDLYEEFYNTKKDPYILIENSQGFYLDIMDYGNNYPYLTSSHVSTAGALLNYLPPQAVKDVYGIVKAYTTYVGSKKFQLDGEIYNKIGDIGHEYGATTGRRRQVNYLNINDTYKAVQINGVNILIVNKMDILQQVGVWNVIYNNEIVELKEEKKFKKFLKEKLGKDIKIIFSYRADRI